MLKTNKTILTNWNDYFGYDCTEEFSGINYDTIFNDYLLFNNKDVEYDYTTKICFVEKVKPYLYTLTYYDSKKLIEVEIGSRAKRKFYNKLEDFDIIITKEFPISADGINKNKIILRHEVIKNIFTSNNTHFFDKLLPFSIDDNRVFLTKEFYNQLIENEDKLNALMFGSFLLNQFEIGLTIDDIKLKPKISISNYGRWYWSGSEKVQNDNKSRNRIFNKFLKYGKILSIDLTSGEPTILCQLTNSKLLKKLLKYRLSLKKTDKELSTAVKNLINIFIHSSADHDTIANQYKDHCENSVRLEKKLGIEISDLLACLQDDFMCYNRYVIDEHRKNLSVKELNRRIVIPNAHVLSDKDLIKEHRKYLQGNAHDRILNLARLNYTTTGLIPIFTIHDSVSYFINNSDADNLSSIILDNAKQMKYPIELEILEGSDN